MKKIDLIEIDNIDRVTILREHTKEVFGVVEFLEEYDLCDESDDDLVVAHHFEVKCNDGRLLTIAYDLQDEEGRYAVWALENSNPLTDHWYFSYELEVVDGIANATSGPRAA